MTFLLILPVLFILLTVYLVRIVRADVPTFTPASHGDWSADDLPTSAYALPHNA